MQIGACRFKCYSEYLSLKCEYSHILYHIYTRTWPSTGYHCPISTHQSWAKSNVFRLEISQHHCSQVRFSGRTSAGLRGSRALGQVKPQCTYLEISQHHRSQICVGERTEGGRVEARSSVHTASRLPERPVGGLLDQVAQIGAGVARRVRHHLAPVTLGQSAAQASCMTRRRASHAKEVFKNTFCHHGWHRSQAPGPPSKA